MNKSEYLVYAYKNEFHLILRWYLEVFAIHFEDIDYEYITIKNGIKYLKIGDQLVPTETEKYKPIFDIQDVIKLPANTLPNLSESIYTSVGIYISNLLFLVHPFNSSIGYINNFFTLKSIESKLPNLLKSGTITVEQRNTFINSVSFALNLNKLFSYSSTRRSVTPAPGITKFKNDLIKKYDQEYGKHWVEDEVKALQFIEELKKYDKDYIKNDPSYGKMLSGKIVNNSRPRMYMAFGVESGFDNTGKDNTFVINSLSEGYPKNKKHLKAIMNSARKGSYDRGAETQQAGSMVKEMQRASNALYIKEGDCGTKLGLPMLITEKNLKKYSNTYIVEKGITIFKESLKDYIGKTVILRSTMGCKNVDCFCEICGSKDLLEYKNGVSLLIISSAGVVLNLKMKALHKASKQLVKFNITDYIK